MKNQTAEEVFRNKGNVIELDSKSPLFLHCKDKDKKKFWIVKSGEINIFTVSFVNGMIEGQRNYLFTAKEGDALFTLNFEQNNNEQTLVAIGNTGAEVAEYQEDVVSDLNGNSEVKRYMINLIEKWADNLSFAVGKDELLPTSNRELISGKEIVVKERVYYHPPSDQTIWVNNKKGNSFFMGKKEWFNLPKDTFFPISPHAWIESEEESILYTKSAWDMLQEISLWKALDQFHELIAKSIISTIEHREKMEQLRFKNRNSVNREAFSDTLFRIKELFNKKIEKISFKYKEKNSLLAAVKLVAESSGIKIYPLKDKDKEQKITLDRIARNSRFRIRKVALRGKWWKEDNGPLLAFQKDNEQPVALIPDKNQEYMFCDPEKGLSKKVTSQTASELKSFAFTFYRTFPEEKMSFNEFIKFGFRDCRKDFIRVFVMGILGGLLALLLPFMMGIVFDNIIPQAELEQLVQIIAILVISSAVIFVFQISRDISVLRIEGKVETYLQAALWDRLISLPASFFRKFSAGELTQRGFGVIAIKERVSAFLVNSIIAFIFSIFYFGLLFYYNTHLTLMVMGIFLLLLLFFSFILKRLIYYHQKRINLENKIAGLVLQFLSGIAKLRVFGVEDRALNIWNKIFTEKTKLSLEKFGKLENLIIASTYSFPAMMLMIVFSWIIGRSAGDFSVGHFVGFVTALTFFQTTLFQLIVSLVMTIEIIPIYNNIKPILNATPESDETKVSPDELTGNIEVNGAYFSYNEDGPLILKDISLQVEAGEFIAFVGPSGSGKSTLFRQLVGFETLTSGTIYYDGKDLYTLDIREVRRQIGVVLQNSKLVPGDILTNIIGASNLTIDDARAAIQMVGLEDDIYEMPMGLFTMVDPSGGTLSGGQRQRILIARAIVKKPRILFFDEATSALDNKTQQIVANSIDQLKTTRIVIAHRLSTVINADRIYVLQNGEIVQVGSYNELMQQKGLFLELAKRQLS
jgi:ATP-binding cassette subfamily C protein